MVEHNVTIDQFVSEVIGKAWLKDFELHNLEYRTFHTGEQPQSVFISATFQDPENPDEEHEMEASGSYIGEALAMVLEEFRSTFG